MSGFGHHRECLLVKIYQSSSSKQEIEFTLLLEFDFEVYCIKSKFFFLFKKS